MRFLLGGADGVAGLHNVGEPPIKEALVSIIDAYLDVAGQAVAILGKPEVAGAGAGPGSPVVLFEGDDLHPGLRQDGGLRRCSRGAER